MKYLRQADKEERALEVAEVRRVFEAAVTTCDRRAIAHAAIDVINIIGDSEIEAPIVNTARRHLAVAMDLIYGPLPADL